MRGRVNAIRTFKGLVADLRLKKNNKRVVLVKQTSNGQAHDVTTMPV